MQEAINAANMALPRPCTVPTSVAKNPLMVAMLSVLIPKASAKAPICENCSAISCISPSILLYISVQISPRPPTVIAHIKRFLSPNLNSLFIIANISYFSFSKIENISCFLFSKIENISCFSFSEIAAVLPVLLHLLLSLIVIMHEHILQRRILYAQVLKLLSGK